MGVFTFVCRESGSDWTAKQLNGELEASADSTFGLQRKLVQAALSSDSGAVQSSFSYVTPKSAVFQVIVGGGGGGSFVGGGGAAAAASGGGGGAAAEAPAAEKKEEEKEESDDDIGMSLFDDE
ncbi:LOW QUALITY PROTEIN: 60S acidic ribosomal protein P3-like [Salvia miltiorrhiza]|uniref:LOW QUALITY PROTEIN: 60S acidic ribosomal protein P3-like n=1 Tax=Salvia miltiorrhiza TaxID=226208 RepID=UPI0025ABC3F5|nr:LOW QUALITY PROTEIN: 60S acidic ribosomal protein P3-like [Salvia miltiorrhiza]